MRATFYAIAPALLAAPNTVLLIGDVGGYGLREAFAKYPDRCFNCGAAEQAMVSMAAGMAKEGMYPIIHTFSSFLARRAYEQIYLNFGVQKQKGLFVAIGENPAWGPSHICNEDQDLMGLIPGMDYLAPTSPATVDAVLRAAVAGSKLTYIRV